MDSYRLTVVLHIVLGIVLAGQARFWMVMWMALRRHHGAPDVQRWLAVTRGARWPHVMVPRALRLPLPWIAWSTLALLAASGLLIAALTRVPDGSWWNAKLSLLALIAVLQVLMTWRPTPPVIIGNFAVVLATMVV